jgi:hypothetical protein
VNRSLGHLGRALAEPGRAESDEPLPVVVPALWPMAASAPMPSLSGFSAEQVAVLFEGEVAFGVSPLPSKPIRRKVRAAGACVAAATRCAS